VTTEGYPKRLVVLARCRGRNPTAVRGDVADPFAEGANASSIALSLHLQQAGRGGGEDERMARACEGARVRAVEYGLICAGVSGRVSRRHAPNY
jgi:hypothetical protein